MIVTIIMNPGSELMSSSQYNNSNKRNIDPRKLAVLLELMKEAEGKSVDQVLPLILSANKKLQSQNLGFTNDDGEILLELLTKNMPPQKKAQMKMLLNMMSNKK
ncbi:MAG: hypothetical protein GX059_02925 [Clostridiales bacterium]|nr:hypothetical protein [Clostridiales bacterium]